MNQVILKDVISFYQEKLKSLNTQTAKVQQKYHKQKTKYENSFICKLFGLKYENISWMGVSDTYVIYTSYLFRINECNLELTKLKYHDSIGDIYYSLDQFDSQQFYKWIKTK